MDIGRLARRIAVVALLATSSGLRQVHGQESIAVDHAKRIVALLRAEKFDNVAKELNAQMAAALPPSQLRDAWSALGRQFGPFVACLNQRVTTPGGGMTAVVLGCRFEKSAVNVVIAFDAEQKVAGLRFIPRAPAGQAPAAPPPSSRFKDEQVTVGTGEWALPGTLSIPAGPVSAAVVLVSGSGPSDRDGTSGPNKPLRDIAWGLADRGIAVLRYDKRAYRYGAKMARIENFTVREAVVEDALLAAALLRTRSEIDPKRIFVLGHSLGGTLVPRIAAEDQSLAGVVILAGATRPLREVLREQLAYLGSLTPGSVDPEQGLQLVLKAAPDSYWTDLDAYRPAEVAARLRMPMLILQGERDYQVTSVDLQGWRDALARRSDVTIKIYPTLNHLFMPGEGKATPAEYQRPGTVAAFVLEDIARWIDNTPSRPHAAR